MTKTLDKILNGVKKAAVGLGIAALPYFSNAQDHPKFVAGQTVKVQDPNGNTIEAPVLNVQGVYYFEVQKQVNGENSDKKVESDLWVSYTCPRQYSYGSDEPTYTQGLVLGKKDAKFKDKDGETRVGELKLAKKGLLGIDGPKMQELIQQEKSNLSVTQLQDRGRVTGIKTIQIEKADHFVPYMSDGVMDSLVLDVDKKYLANFISLPVRDENGVYTDQQILPGSGQVSLGNFGDGSIYVVDTTKSLKEYLPTDSLKKFLRPANFPSEEYKLQKTGEVVAFAKWKDKEQSDEKKEKKEHNSSMQLNLEAAYSFFTKGLSGKTSLQFPLGESGITAGPYLEYSMAQRSGDASLTIPDSTGQLPNTNLYLKKSGELSESKKINPTWGAGLQMFYDKELYRVGLGLGVQNELLEQKVRTSGDINILDANQNVLDSDAFSSESVYNSSALSPKASVSVDVYPFRILGKGPQGVYAGVEASGVMTRLAGTYTIPELAKVKDYGSLTGKIGYTFGASKSKEKNSSDRKSKKSKRQ